MKKSGLLGAGIKPSDYSISLSNSLIPVGEQNFATNQKTFNQGNSYACTLFACFTLLANKFDLDITDEFILDQWKIACKQGANPRTGWYISSAVDFTRRWFNSQPELVAKHGRLTTGFLTLPYSWTPNKEKTLKLFEEILNNKHDIIGGHHGSRDYNFDFKSDGILDLKKLKNPSYSHCVSMSYSLNGKFDMDSDLIVPNSWKGVAHNVYRLRHIQALIDNNVLFPTIYCFFSEKDEIILTGKNWELNDNDLVKRFNNQYIMLSEDSGAIYDIRGNKAISIDKFFKNPKDRENLIRTYEPLGLLTGISNENFVNMLKRKKI